MRNPMIEDYINKVKDLQDKQQEAFDALRESIKKAEEFNENVVKKNNFHLTPDQKLEEQRLVEEIKKAADDLSKLIDEMRNI